MNLSKLKNKVKKFPKNPGIYKFKDKTGEILYIGKATNLRNRAGSYFQRSDGRANINAMIDKVSNVDFIETDTVLEALILEANLIKEHQPKYNVKEKDDKSFSYFVITKEEFPKILILRKTDFDNKRYEGDAYKKGKIYGPYTSKQQMQVALKIIRKIFPFHSRNEKNEKGCLEYQLGLCPGPYDSAISKADYKKNIRGLRMILEGKKKNLIKKLEKEMRELSKKEEFEKAAEIRNKIFALNHIQDIALISTGEEKFKVSSSRFKDIRIEAYDISNISGDFTVGSMVVFDGKMDNRDEYRKFKIKTIKGANDVGSMKEVLVRRFKNNWKLPDLIILDGGKGHVNMAEKVLESYKLKIPIVGVAKGVTRKIQNYKIVKSSKFPISKSKHHKEIDELLKNKDFIKKITDEAHRFAITYHKKIRDKSLIKK